MNKVFIVFGYAVMGSGNKLLLMIIFHVRWLKMSLLFHRILIFVFLSGNGPELWVLLLEKAYSKIHGCYANIEAGLTGNAIRDLTGAPYEFKSNLE